LACGNPVAHGNRAGGEASGVLSAFRFDAQQSERVEKWESACERLDDDQLLWLALRDPSDDEETAVVDALGLGDELARRLRDSPERASVTDDGKHLYVTLVAVAGDEDAPVLVPVECVLGKNWVVTAHQDEITVLEEFLERAEGGSEVGALEAPSFVAAVGEWVIASYFRAFEAVEGELEELDARVMSETPSRDVSGDMSRLVELRRRIGSLRRALAPHREVVTSLAHPELDVHSTERSAQLFADLERRVTQALDAARDTKESTFGSFDLLVARIGQRTNDIMKVLTLGTVILLPATVLGGIMGMNFKVGLFEYTWLYWVVIAAMLVIAALVLAVARVRHWI
jgi:magnesium transporter